MLKQMPREDSSVGRITSLLLMLLLLRTVHCKRVCPVVCDCLTDRSGNYRPRLLKAVCKANDMKQIPRLTSNVTDLELRSESLQEIRDFAFIDAPFIGGIHLLVDRLAHINSNAFQSLSNLESLTIRSERTVELETGVFRNLKNLVNLKLVANLSQVPTKELCVAFNITRLNLQKNNFQSLSLTPCVETAWKRLNELIFSLNPVKSVKAHDFYHLRNVKLTILSINQCGLTSLPDDLFRYLTHVKSLDIGQNKIQYLPLGIFDSLVGLRLLVLGGTDIKQLPFTDSTPFLSKLVDLNLIACRYLNLTFDPKFLNATDLGYLAISYLNIDTLDDRFFANLINSPIKKIVLRSSKVTSISPKAFKQFTTLQQITLDQNRLRFDDLYNLSLSIGETPIQTLTLNGMKLLEIRSDSFQGFTTNNSLSKLGLRNCEISIIRNNSFARLGNVRRLDLSQNSLKSEGLEPGAFSGMLSLQILSLDQNDFTSFPQRIRLDIPASLSKLILTKNGLAALTYSALREWKNIEYLLLYQNNIQTVTSQAFANFSRIRELGLHGNRISSFPKNTFSSLQTLEVLQLERNYLERLPFGTWKYLGHLKELYLDHNVGFGAYAQDLTNIFEGMLTLKKLVLIQCGIHTLPTSMFSNNGKLEDLYLGFNEISTWDPALFKPLQNLRTLAIGNNKITVLNEDSFSYLVSLRQLDLSDNSLVCTCDLLWFRRWMDRSDLHLKHYGYKHSYVCEGPKGMKGTALVDFQITEDDCVSNWILQLTLGLCSCLLVVCILVSVVYRYWWYVRYYIFLLRSRRRKMQDARSEEEAFKYDVYVCYHNTSRHWVIKKLLPELEFKGGIKLCLHDRDWLAGPTIIENIIESIECSRKTLLLVNNEFARSDWCREETSLAYHRLVQEQRNLLTVVLLEDVRQENMDKTLRSILTKRVYLRFADGKHKEAKFWKGLKAALGKSEVEQDSGMQMQTMN